MAKTITLKFGADGSIIQAESSAANIRQGDSNGEVSVIASFTGKRNDEYVAKFYFERPDGKKQSNILMSPSSSQSSDFVYSIGSAWFFAVAGTAKITVRLTDFDGALSAQGSFSFNVEATQIDVEDSTITYDEAAEIEGLIAQISESAVKKAVQVTIGSNANVSDFYSACIAYYEGNPKDGDRFTASTTGITPSIVRKYAGQFMGDDKMLIVEKQTASLGPGTSVVSQNAYLVTGSSDNPTVTKIGNQDSIDELFSFFDENGNANSAVADSQGNVIHTTYATDASVVHNTGAETIAGDKTFSGQTRFNDAVYSTHIYPTSGAPKFLGFEDKKWEAVHTKSLYLQYGVINYGVYKVRFRGQNGYLAFESYVDDAEAAAKAYADTEVGKLLGGDYVSKKASHDDAGNEIKTYYVAHSDVVDSLDSTSTVNPLSAYQGKVLKGLIDGINAILASDDDTLDEIQEIVTYIKSNKSLIDAITVEKISYTDIVDNLVSQLTTKPLSAKQGYVLKGLIDALSSSKVSVNDIIDNLISSAESAKPLSAKQGYVLKGLIDALDAQLNLSLINVTSIADEYNSALTYSKGDFAVHSLALYRANQDIDTPEEWTSSHWDQVNIVTLIKEKLSKGDYDSSTGVGFADETTAANNLTPYSDESGTEQSKPFVAQGTGTDNNTSIVTVGSLAQLREKQGNAIRWRQIVNPSALTGNSAAGITTSVSGNVVSVSGTAGSRISRRLTGSSYISVEQNHKYLIIGMKKNSLDIGLIFNAYNNGSYVTTYSGSDTGSGLVVDNNRVVNQLSLELVVPNGTVVPDNFSFVPLVIDLGIETYTLTSPRVLWSMQYAALHPEFNAGELVSGDGVTLVCTKRNLLNQDLLAEVSGITKNGDTFSANNGVWNATNIFSKIGYVVPLRSYCFRAKLSPSSGLTTAKVRVEYTDGTAQGGNNISGGSTGLSSLITTAGKQISKLTITYGSGSGTIVATDLDLDLYYTPEEGGEGYDQHYPYEAPKTYNTGNEPLYGVEGCRDGKAPDGTITRRRRRYTFSGNETWVASGQAYYIAGASLSIKPPSSNGRVANIICDSLTATSANNLYSNGNTTSGIAINTTGNLWIGAVDYASVSSLIGKTIEYELTEPTTEEGTPFSENVEVNDYGMMYWLDANGDLISVPQGARFFYPVDYKGTLDDIYHRIDGDAGNIALNGALASGDPATLKALKTYVDGLHAIEQENAGGLLRHQLVAQVTAGGGTLAFEDTDWDDMGDFNWQDAGISNLFGAPTPSGMASGINAICSIYKTIAQTPGVTAGNMTIQIRSDFIYVKNASFPDVTTFKAAMKGILIAYEKA